MELTSYYIHIIPTWPCLDMDNDNDGVNDDDPDDEEEENNIINLP